VRVHTLKSTDRALHSQLDGKYSERVQLPAKVCPMVLLTWGHFGHLSTSRSPIVGTI